ncbi:Myc-type basic helix-loop-helix (bHLH) domain [Arabidopsis suecica]|uniref:Myc-type basic helix-loop-helix (BHLH) domain n=1 Tax=Arabidopsis suecica TaxID=45249 RepID=A0A8T2CKT8_ARASU|nr:Myc-type basic helix-loop-helix (bHLH) domain [Arabidopsis suecica]
MVSPENTNWLSDYPLIDGAFSVQYPTFPWQIDASATVSVEVDGFLCDSDVIKEPGSRKRIKTESCTVSSSKACREKQRRDRLNDKFTELSSILEPGRAPKTDKVAIINDAIRMVNQAREEAQKLKDLNLNLQEKIKELKDEKNELRDEKQKLKIEKERIDQQLKAIKTQPQPCFLPNPPTLSQAQAPGSKLVPFTTYPGFAMWQFMPPAAVDTSQDHVLRPPVA